MGRPYVYCDICANRESSDSNVYIIDTLPDTPNAPDAPGPLVGYGPQRKDAAKVLVEDAYRRRLEEMGRENSPEGLLALSIAHALDTEFHTGASRAALSAKLMMAWDKATAGAPIEEDQLDEIARARRKRFGG
jgi:hypothetical protein